MTKIKRVSAYLAKPYDAEIEYLESTGTQWIDTGVVANRTNFKALVCFSLTSLTTQALLASSKTESGLFKRSYVLYYDDLNDLLKLYSTFINGTWDSNRCASVGQKAIDTSYNVEITLTNGYITLTDLDSGIFSTKLADTPPNVTLGLGANNNPDGIMAPSFAKFYSCKLYTNGTLIRDLIPVRFMNELGNTEGAMYDKVSGQLFRNQGSDSFVMGPDKRKHTKVYMVQRKPYDAEIEYLESTGTQFNHSWIDSGIVPDNTIGLKFGLKDLQPPSASSDINFIGCRNATVRFMVNYYKGLATYGFNSWNSNTGIAFNVNLYHEISLNFMNTRKFTFDDHLVNITDTITDTNLPSIGLFQQTRNDTGSGGYIQKLYFVKISRDSTLVRDFIPVRFTNEQGQSEGAMYDKVSGQLFKNQGTGSFVLGPDKPKQTKQISVNLVSKYSAKDYVQDSLIAMWDGIENAGWGVHDDNATIWKDLVGSNDLTNHGCVVTSNSMNSSSRYTYLNTSASVNMPSAFTIELSLSKWTITTGHELIFLAFPYINAGSGVRYYFRADNVSTPKFIYQCGTTYGDRKITNILVSTYTHTTMTMVCSGTYKYLYLNGINVDSATRTLTGEWASKGIFIASTASTGSAEYLIANYHAGRIYSRTLTSDEIAHNYAVDKARFNLP